MLISFCKMELIHLILNSVDGEMCFLCYKESLNTQNIRSNLEIRSKLFKETLSLADMVIQLFPSFELTLTKACDSCADLITTMYIAMQRNTIMKTFINNIINTFNKQINNNNTSSTNCLGKLDIIINLSKVTNVKKQEFQKQEFSQNYDFSNTVDENYDEILTNNKIDDSFSQEIQCSTCYKLFDDKKKYKTHMKNHKRSRKKVNHCCNHCNYKSLSKQSLQGHINKKHLKIRPHVCNVCFKEFYYKKNLVEHEKGHSNVRNEVCDVCGDRFIHKKNLLEHLMLHSGEKPYPCQVCNKRFVTSGRRLEHVKRCHSEKNECCILCDKKFGLIKELKRHMKSVHS